MKKLGKVIIVFVVFLALSGTASADATELTSYVRSTIDSSLAILNDPALSGKTHAAERKAGVSALIDETIDFKEMTKRSLGVHWKKRTYEEKSEFVRLFSKLLKASYMDQIETNYDARVLYTGEKINKKHTRGLVRTVVKTRKDTEVPIDYRMMKKDGGWVAYDIVIEGVSLVSNYRTQFGQIIQRSSYDELIKSLREKMKKQKVSSSERRQ